MEMKRIVRGYHTHLLTFPAICSELDERGKGKAQGKLAGAFTCQLRTLPKA
jgi:hypothetical protein